MMEDFRPVVFNMNGCKKTYGDGRRDTRIFAMVAS